MWHRSKKSSAVVLMFHIKVTCQKSFALTRMNSAYRHLLPEAPMLLFLSSQRFEFARLAPHPSSPFLTLSRVPASLSSAFLAIFYSFCVPSRLTSGFVPLIEHSCRTHCPSQFFPLPPLVLLHKLARCLTRGCSLVDPRLTSTTVADVARHLTVVFTPGRNCDESKSNQQSQSICSN